MSDLQELRRQIDEVDDRIFEALCERVNVCRAIGAAKRKQGLAVRDSTRENEVYERVEQKCVKFGLDSRKVEAVYREIVNMCSAVQSKEP